MNIQVKQKTTPLKRLNAGDAFINPSGNTLCMKALDDELGSSEILIIRLDSGSIFRLPGDQEVCKVDVNIIINQKFTNE